MRKINPDPAFKEALTNTPVEVLIALVGISTIIALVAFYFVEKLIAKESCDTRDRKLD